MNYKNIFNPSLICIIMVCKSFQVSAIEFLFLLLKPKCFLLCCKLLQSYKFRTHVPSFQGKFEFENFFLHTDIDHTSAHRLLWALFKAFEATPITFRTSVFVLAFSNASLWNSIVDRVPSICCNCFSYLFFLLRA